MPSENVGQSYCHIDHREHLIPNLNVDQWKNKYCIEMMIIVKTGYFHLIIGQWGSGKLLFIIYLLVGYRETRYYTRPMKKETFFKFWLHRKKNILPLKGSSIEMLTIATREYCNWNVDHTETWVLLLKFGRINSTIG